MMDMVASKNNKNCQLVGLLLFNKEISIFDNVLDALATYNWHFLAV